MNSKKIPMLSKSKYLAGLQCPLRLWHQCYNPHLAPPVPPAKQALFDTGHEVGRLATRLYPDGVLVETDPRRHEEAIGETLKAMEDPMVKSIFEAGFSHEDVRVKVDILERVEAGNWNLVEVKSSTRVKNEYLPDVSVQCHVLQGAGLEIDRAILLLHLNNQYVYDGHELDLEGLFTASDLTREALVCQGEITAKLKEFKDILENPDPPGITPSMHCFHPFECEFWEHCSQGLPEHWVVELGGIERKKLDQLTAMGVEDIRDIHEGFPLTETQERIRRCVKYNEEYVSGELRAELEAVEYPVHFLDFETLGLAVPRYAGTRPYQSVPFQWSDHVLHEDGRVEHLEYLCDEDKDPREEFATTLLDALRTELSIVTYTSYEEGTIRGLAEEFLQYSERLLATLDRIVDLHAIIRKHYYHPAFHGSFFL
jgi:hypothetical protein